MKTGAISSIFRDRVDRPLTTKPIAFFLGAGVDIAAGGMTFQSLKAEIVALFRNIRFVNELTDKRVDEIFEDILANELEQRDRGGLIHGAFHRIDALRPSEGHLLLALLARQGGVDRVITTNFDTLIEKAEAEIGERIFQIYAPGVAQPDMQGGEVLLTPRPEYLKLHGDLEARRITHLARKEIDALTYDRPISVLLTETFRTHRVFFIGYGGYDTVVAKAIEQAGGLSEPCYWVNPVAPDPDAPVVKTIGATLVNHIPAKSDPFMREAIREALAQTDLVFDTTVFVESLVAERIRRSNARFLTSQHQISPEDRAQLLQPRQSVDGKIAAFRRDPKSSLALLIGPSGVGKSAIAVRLCDKTAEKGFPGVLAIAARSFFDTDITRRILTELETGNGGTTPRLFEFSAWLAKHQLDLMVVIDGLNEFSQNTEDVARFLRATIDALHRIRPHGHLKILISLREEIWSEVLPLLDAADLKRVLWSPEQADPDSISVISVGLFNEEETRRAFDAYARKFRPDAVWETTSPMMRRMIGDPFILKEVMMSDTPLGSSTFNRALMANILRTKLSKRLSPGQAETLMRTLTNRAGEAEGNPIVAVDTIDAADVRLLVDANILSHNAEGRFQFFHDRTYEFFLARWLEDNWPVHEFEDLVSILDRSSKDRHLRSALLACFVEPAPGVIKPIRRILNDAVETIAAAAVDERQKAMIELFVNDVMSEMARQNPRHFVDIVFANATADRPRSQWYARLLIRSACLLPDDDALHVWTTAMTWPVRDLRVEAEILFYDRVAQRIVESGGGDFTLLKTAPVARFFYDEGQPATVAMARLLFLASRLGPDNLSAREWTAFSGQMRIEIGTLVDRISPPRTLWARRKLAEPFANIDDLDANRFLFNAKASWLVDQFQDTWRKTVFTPIIEGLASNQAIQLDAYQAAQARSGEIGDTLSFLCLNLSCALSYRVDKTATLKMFKAVEDTLGPTSPVTQIDLYLSCLFVAIALNQEDASNAIESATRNLISRCPQIHLVNPGEERSRRHGHFLDEFDQQFEDGFNPLAICFYHAPSAQRRAVSYRRSLEQNPADLAVPLYSELLETFERDRQARGVIRIIHALGQMVSVWPHRGLAELAPLAGRQEPTVRRAMKRVLAEANVRFPSQCSSMLEAAGAAFSREDHYDIRCRYDPRLSQRTLEQVQWCRILSTAEACFGQGFSLEILQALATRSTWWEALSDIIQATLQRDSLDDSTRSK